MSGNIFHLQLYISQRKIEGNKLKLIYIEKNCADVMRWDGIYEELFALNLCVV